MWLTCQYTQLGVWIMKIGIESCYGFGDCLMNVAILNEIFNSEIRVDVATSENNTDAFHNIPNINVIPLKGFRPLGKGVEYFKANDYDIVFQKYL